MLQVQPIIGLRYSKRATPTQCGILLETNVHLRKFAYSWDTRAVVFLPFLSQRADRNETKRWLHIAQYNPIHNKTNPQ